MASVPVSDRAGNTRFSSSAPQTPDLSFFADIRSHAKRALSPHKRCLSRPSELPQLAEEEEKGYTFVPSSVSSPGMASMSSYQNYHHAHHAHHHHQHSHDCQRACLACRRANSAFAFDSSSPPVRSHWPPNPTHVRKYEASVSSATTGNSIATVDTWCSYTTSDTLGGSSAKTAMTSLINTPLIYHSDLGLSKDQGPCVSASALLAPESSSATCVSASSSSGAVADPIGQRSHTPLLPPLIKGARQGWDDNEDEVAADCSPPDTPSDTIISTVPIVSPIPVHGHAVGGGVPLASAVSLVESTVAAGFATSVTSSVTSLPRHRHSGSAGSGLSTGSTGSQLQPIASPTTSTSPSSTVPPFYATETAAIAALEEHFRHKLGHWNQDFSQPYVPLECSRATCVQLFCDWAAARAEFERGNFGLAASHSETTYNLLLEKWRALDGCWKRVYSQVYSSLDQHDQAGVPTASEQKECREAVGRELIMFQHLQADRRMVMGADSAVVGLMVKAEPRAVELRIQREHRTVWTRWRTGWAGAWRRLRRRAEVAV